MKPQQLDAEPERVASFLILTQCTTAIEDIRGTVETPHAL